VLLCHDYYTEWDPLAPRYVYPDSGHIDINNGSFYSANQGRVHNAVDEELLQYAGLLYNSQSATNSRRGLVIL
jgi:hypothetical protein